MKLTSDSPEITAYALGEVSPEEHAVIEKAIAESPELRAEIAALRRLADTLETQLSAEPEPELDEGRRDRILEAAAHPERAALVEPSPAVGPLQWFSRLWTGITRPVVGFSLAAATALSISLALWTPWKVRPEPSIEGSNRVAAPRLKNQALAAPPMAGPVAGLAGGAPVASKPSADDALVTAHSANGGLAKLGSDVAKLSDGPASASPNAVRSQPVSGAPAGVAGRMNQLSSADPTTPLDAAEPALVRSRGALPAVSAAQSTTPRPPGDRLELSTGAATAEMKPKAEAFFYDRADAKVDKLAVPTPSTHDYFGVRQLAESVAESREPVRLELRRNPESERLYRFTTPSPAPATRASGERYQPIVENPFREVAAAPLSTFGMDADTASYANARRFLREGSLPPRDAVRLEELVNYFPYDYAGPKGREPFAANVEVSDCPWNPEHRLVRIGLKARESDVRERPRANLVFLVDVSGSMSPDNKLPLVQRSLRLLLDQLDPKDQVGVVTYAGEANVALEPTPVSRKAEIQQAIDALRAGSGTHGSAGIERAYAMATNRFIAGGVNRVVLCTDGDFNLGLTRREDLLDLITAKAKSGVFLSVLGYGSDNLRYDTAELLADRGNGNYSYIDSFTEARKVLKQEVRGTLQTVAKDAKIQVEFNPARVVSWRLLGYENRVLADRDFNDDKKDAGEVGAGHSVTALYEIVPAAGRKPGVDPLRYAKAEATPKSQTAHGDELLNLKVRYKEPEADTSRLLEVPVRDPDHDASAATADFKFAAAVVGYGLMLRDSPQKGDLTWDKVLKLAEEGLGPDREGYRAEFIDLVRRAKQLSGR
jgi:secreted protein with Ig-like and vWFA domain/anti-sigma factor RsiW